MTVSKLLAPVSGPVIARSVSDEAIQPFLRLWIASRSLSSGAHSRDPLARNGGLARIRATRWLAMTVSKLLAPVSGPVIARSVSDEAIHSFLRLWIASLRSQ
jgi:hypothetical protein